jgi:hypothetical protein
MADQRRARVRRLAADDGGVACIGGAGLRSPVMLLATAARSLSELMTAGGRNLSR